MSTTTECAHCGARYQRGQDTYDDEPDGYLCPDCADYAVLGGPCASCGEIPGRRPCRDRTDLHHYRALARADWNARHPEETPA